MSDVLCSIQYQSGLVHRSARQPHLRARPKVSALDNARDETASDMCESSVTRKSHGRVCKLIDLVLIILSSSIEDTVTVVDETDALRTLVSSTRPLPRAGSVIRVLTGGLTAFEL